VKHSVPCEFPLTASFPVASPGGVSVHTDHSQGTRLDAASLHQSHDSPVAQSLQQAPALNVLDLELLHNFCTSTCYTLHSEPNLKTLWRINVPQLGFAYDFVMHGILALSSLHLAHCRPRHRDRFLSQAVLQNQAGLRTVSSIIPNITKENCSAVYLFSVLTFIITLASPRMPGDILVNGDTGLPEWLTLFRGIQLIVMSSQDELRSGVLGPMFTAGAHRVQLRDTQAAEGSAGDDPLGPLRFSIQQTVTDPHLLDIYTDAISELQKSFKLVSSGVTKWLESTDVFIFLFRVSQEYLLLLKDRTQEALAIFAHFCIIAKGLEYRWWSRGFGDHLMSNIYPLLDEEHKVWIRWPMEEIGWFPTHDT
jgi:hypothetical protein